MRAITALRLAGVAHHGVLCAVIDRDLRDTVYAAKIVFQHIRLMQRHPGAVQMYPQAAWGTRGECCIS